ncbi:HD domain-containing protein [Candidatus Pacearchaeota archaeon]|nr:HD domain-containing protein [Candidatus Pacearchaeota archaeon]
MNILKKILDLRKNKPKKENEIIVKAYKFAQKAHKGQFLDGTKHPYFTHPSYAGYLLAKWGRGYEEICGGLLHDVFEDCQVHMETLWRNFGHRVAFIVDGMSWERLWNPKKKMYLKDFEHFHKKRLNYIKQDMGVLFVLFSDELSNLDDMFPEDYARLKKMSKEKKAKKKKRWGFVLRFLVPFYRELGLTKLANHVENKIMPYTGKMKSELRTVLSKKDVLKIKKKLDKIKGIEELR